MAHQHPHLGHLLPQETYFLVEMLNIFPQSSAAVLATVTAILAVLLGAMDRGKKLRCDQAALPATPRPRAVHGVVIQIT